MGKFKNFFEKAGKVVVGVARKIPNPVGLVVDAVASAVEYISEKRKARKEKREQESVKLQNDFQEQNQQVQQQQKVSSQHFAESFGDESYDVESANAAEIRRMSQELKRIQQEFKDNSENIENKIIEFVQDSIKDMIKEFEEINSQEIGSSKLNLNISYLTSTMNKMENQITGYIQNNVKRRLSLDSEECADILKIHGKSAKKQAMKDYQNDIFNDAIESLWAMIKDSISVQNEAIFRQINNRLDTLELNASDSIKQLEEIEQAKKLGEEELAAKQSEYQNMIDIASWCLDEITKEISA